MYFCGAGSAVPVTLPCLFILFHSSSAARMPAHRREPGIIKNEKDQTKFKRLLSKDSFGYSWLFWLSIEMLGFADGWIDG